VDSKGALGSSPGRSFLAPEIAYLAGLSREAQERETGSIGSEGDLRRWIWVSRIRIGDSENLGFHLNYGFSLHLNVTFF